MADDKFLVAPDDRYFMLIAGIEIRGKRTFLQREARKALMLLQEKNFSLGDNPQDNALRQNVAALVKEL